MPDHKTYRFFLGANSPDGFVSFFDHLINLDTAKEVIIIKGGPGVGKSSFMRRAAAVCKRALRPNGSSAQPIPIPWMVLSFPRSELPLLTVHIRISLSQNIRI